MHLEVNFKNGGSLSVVREMSWVGHPTKLFEVSSDGSYKDGNGYERGMSLDDVFDLIRERLDQEWESFFEKKEAGAEEEMVSDLPELLSKHLKEVKLNL